MRFTTPDPFRARKQGSSDLAVRAIALAVFILGILNIWSALLAQGPGRGHFLRETVHLPLVVQHASRTIIALFGLALLMLARSLARHKRQAWWIALILAVTSSIPHLAKGLDYEEAVISLALALVLLLFRHAFYAENDRPSARQAVFAAIGIFLMTAIYGPLGYYLLRVKFKPQFTWDRAIRQTTHQIFFVPAVRSFAPRTDTPRAHWFDNSLQTISVLSMAYGLMMLLRPVLPRERQSSQERDRIRKILADYPPDPISYFTLLPDKTYIFDQTDTDPAWAVAYVVVGRTAIVLGDPLGDREFAADAISAFLARCRRDDWMPVFYQVSSRNIGIYRAERLRALKVGEDAILDLAVWSLKGKAFQDLRSSLNKMARAGIQFEEFRPENADADTMTQLDGISEEWLSAQKGEEKTFALGRFDLDGPAFHEGRVFLAREAATNRVLAFVTFVPIFGSGWGLDLMRRGAKTPNGLMEFLITSSALRFQEEGASIMSLGLSPLAGGAAPEPGETEIIARGRELFYQRFNLFYGFKGIHAFKEKFGPRWEPRYLIYAGETSLATSAFAIIRAHSPRGLHTFIRK